MNELLLMKIITGLSIAVVLIIYILPRLNIRFTKDSFKGFSSIDEFLGYFKFALNTLNKHRILFLFPLMFVLIYQIMFCLMFYISRLHLGAWNRYDIDFISKFINLQNLLLSINLLDFGYYGFSLRPFFFVILFGIIYLAFNQKFLWLNKKKRKYIKYFYLLFLILVLSFSFVFILNNELFSNYTVVKIIVLFFGFNFSIFEPILDVLVNTVLESIILVSFLFILKYDFLDYKSIVNKSGEYLKGLFVFNMVFAIPTISHYISSTSFSLPMFYGGSNKYLSQISYIFNYVFKISYDVLGILFLLFTLFPMIYVYNRLSIKESLIRNIDFICQNFLKYLILIIVGIFIIYFSILIYEIPSTLIGGYSSVFEPIVDTVSKTFRLFLAVIFYIALFKFYIDTEKHSSQNSAI